VAALLAVALDAERLLFVTDVTHAFDYFGRPDAREIRAMHAAEARERLARGVFAPGSMAPKVESAVTFVAATGREAVIATWDGFRRLAGRAGCRPARWPARRAGARPASTLVPPGAHPLHEQHRAAADQPPVARRPSRAFIGRARPVRAHDDEVDPPGLGEADDLGPTGRHLGKVAPQKRAGGRGPAAAPPLQPA
jgi:hypothetical protein